MPEATGIAFISVACKMPIQGIHLPGPQGKNASNQFLILPMLEHTCLFNHAMILQVI